MTHAPKLASAIPILRVKDARASETFYHTHFGFTTDWVHQFEPGFPLMMSITRNACTLFLSEHRGTGTDNCEFYIYADDVDAIYETAADAGLRFDVKPVTQLWGVREIQFTDPDGHRCTMGQKMS